jgi:ribosomal protein L32E
MHDGSIGRFRGKPLGALLIILILMAILSPALSSAWTFPYDVGKESRIEEVISWRHPDGEGMNLRFEPSHDGTMLLLTGYGGPDEVRVVDRNLTTLMVLALPEEPFHLKGATWSELDDRIAVWGTVGAIESDVLVLFDVTTTERNESAPWLDIVDLETIDEVTFLAGDLIVAVAGRDGTGTSILKFIEAQVPRVHRSFVWHDNNTIVEINYSLAQIIVVDEVGNVEIFSAMDWTSVDYFEGLLDGGPTGWYMPWNRSWGVGDAQGRLFLWIESSNELQSNITVGEGPVQGFTWTEGRSGDFLVAVERSEGGSRLMAWQRWDEFRFEQSMGELNHLNLTANVTMMATDPGGWGWVMVAFDDGTLAIYKFVVRPLPREMSPGVPEEWDGLGLEPFRKWRHEDGKGADLRFTFNHQGTLILLQGYRSPKDVRVVNRTLGTVAVLGLNEGSTILKGIEWSSNDRYLVAWKQLPDGPPINFIVYDVPTFKISRELELDWLEKMVDYVVSIEFLPGDDALAVACIYEGVTKLLIVDLGTMSVIIEHQLPTIPEPFIDLSMDGNDLVAITEDGAITTFSQPDWSVNQTDVGIDGYPARFDVHGGSGWLYEPDFQNLSVFTGHPRTLTYEVHDLYDSIYGLAWTRVAGDFVIGFDSIFYGTKILLFQTQDRPDIKGVQVLSQLNTSKYVVQLAGDPLYPGLVAASFTDGTFGLYHLNLTPYPPPPEEIGGEDIGPVDDPNGGNGGNGGDGNGGQAWGSIAADIFLVAIIVALVAVSAIYLWLRSREDGDAEGGPP